MQPYGGVPRLPVRAGQESEPLRETAEVFPVPEAAHQKVHYDKRDSENFEDTVEKDGAHR